MNTVTRFYRKLLHRFPTRLPDGMTNFETWSQDIVSTYGFPDNDSVRFMLAAMILQDKNVTAYTPKRYFGLLGLAAASKEVAHAKMVALKDAQEARAAAEAEAAAKAANIEQPKLAEVVAIPLQAATSNVPSISQT